MTIHIECNKLNKSELFYINIENILEYVLLKLFSFYWSKVSDVKEILCDEYCDSRFINLFEFC